MRGAGAGVTVHLDVSQLLLDPRRSGIQRAERELIRHWPEEEALVPCRYDAGCDGLVEVSPAIFGVLCGDAPAGGVEAEAAALRGLAGAGRPVSPGRVLNAELFTDAARARFYRRRPSSCRAYWLVYDFLPWLQPEWFHVGAASVLMPYLDALLSVPDLAFISERTRAEHAERVARRPAAGPVIRLGGDGLGLERQAFRPGRRRFVMLGTIEPRKNAWPVMEAFRRLWERGVEAELVMIGAVAPDAEAEIGMMGRLEGHPSFRLLQGASDHDVRKELRGARAMVFPSEGEGFGIPPMEALHAGIPVIISEGLPAVAGAPGLGQIRLGAVTPETVMAAVLEVLDDERGAALWREAALMPVPGWEDFARGVAAWVCA